MPNFNLTFEQYNRAQELLTKKYQKKLAHNKDICIGGFIKVKKSEVQERLKQLGINIHWDTVLNWERAGLLPKSKMVGREKDFPEDYFCEVYATYQLKKGRYRLTNASVKSARKKALEVDATKLFREALYNEAFTGDSTIALNWLQEKIRAHPDFQEPKEWLKVKKELKDLERRIENKAQDRKPEKQ